MKMELNFGVGECDGKFHAYWDDPEGERMLGPARDTEAEALKDRDNAAILGAECMAKHFPRAKLRVERPRDQSV
jgi:hypothetical protein